MLDFGFSEIVLTSAIALIVLGPEKLPKVARQMGNWMGRARAMARQLTEQLEREVDAEDLMKQTRKNAGAAQPAGVPAGTAQSGGKGQGISSAALPFDTSYTPPAEVAPQSAPPAQSPDNPPQAPARIHGADGHSSPTTTNKSSDG